MDRTILISIPCEAKVAFAQHWKDLRIADGLDPDNDLRDPVTISRFDGGSLAQWAIEFTNTITPLVTAALGYLIAKRGEVEIKSGKNTVKFRKLTPSEIKNIVLALNARPNTNKKTPKPKTKRTR